jgi:hypothetical protein
LTNLEELHEAAVIQAMRRDHACNTGSRRFKVGDFVQRKIQMTETDTRFLQFGKDPLKWWK